MSVTIPGSAEQRSIGATSIVRGNADGLVIVGRGLVGRWELSVELYKPEATASGAGRRLIGAGLDVVPAGEWCWAQVAPGNARSLRAFVASGFVPVGSEALIHRAECSASSPTS